MRDASLRPSHFSLPAAMTWAGQGSGGGVVGGGVQCGRAAVRCSGAVQCGSAPHSYSR
jgi:hypothetical protein